MPRRSNDLRAPLPPLADLEPPKRPLLAPAWVALLAVWIGLLDLLAAVVFIFLPGSTDPRAELTHEAAYSLADRFLPLPIYGAAVAMFLGIVVLWQMRREPRPLPEGLGAQRVQAWTAILLSLLAAAVIYADVALFGPARAARV